jgi:FkbM family methyltransferase
MAIGLALRKPVVIEHHGYQAMCPNGILLLGTGRSVCPGHFMAGHYLQCLRCNSGDMGWLESLRSLVLQFPRRWLCKLASANVAITDHVRRRIALPRTQTVLYGIRDPGCTREPQDGNVVEIGYVGRLVQEKGLPVLLNAAKQLQDEGRSFHLTLVGDGPLRKQLEDESQHLGVASRVKFTGELAGADLDRAVRPLQVVVMPSLCEETAGLSAIEQMMRGGVVVASDIGGLTEVLGDAGLKFTPGDSHALCARLRELLEKPSLAASLSSAARERASKVFKLQTMIEAYVALYGKLVGTTTVREASGPVTTTMAQRATAAIARWIPPNVKIALRGKSSSPRWIAEAIHRMVNWLPANRYPILDCRGVLDGYRMRLDWNKHRSFAYGTWEPEVVDAVLRSMEPGMVAIDVGAHGGFYALLLAKVVGPDGKVIALEPLPANFRFLKENVAINTLRNVAAEPLAASDHSGDLAIEVPDEASSLLAGPLADADERGTAHVRCVGLDEYCSAKQLRPDFIKIDVEGAENDVLNGARHIVNEFHPTMMIELHDFAQPEEHPIVIRLRAMGYAIEWLGEIRYTAHFLARWMGG